MGNFEHNPVSAPTPEQQPLRTLTDLAIALSDQYHNKRPLSSLPKFEKALTDAHRIASSTLPQEPGFIPTSTINTGAESITFQPFSQGKVIVSFRGNQPSEQGVYEGRILCNVYPVGLQVESLRITVGLREFTDRPKPPQNPTPKIF